MALGTALAIGAGIGALAGAIPKTSSQDWSSSISLGPASKTETNQLGFLEQNFNDLRALSNAGPGKQDVQNSLNSTRSLADMFGQYAQSGGLPTDQDISSSNQIATNLFNPQRVAMQQAFQDQSTEANRRAALMGRSMNDPILAAKLAQEQTRQGAMLEAQQGSFAQQFALQQPDRRLGYASQQANVLGGLATQAMANRQALSAMGEGILGREREFRLATANRSGTQSSTSGGGIGGAISGGLAGAGMGANLFSMFGNSGGGGGGFNFGGGAQAPSQFSGMNYGQPANSMFGVSSASSLIGGLR
jgi:hypothetical protein